MSTWPKISVIIPSFNQGKYIRETINSLLDQHYPALEIIIIDGGSTDNSVEIISSFNKQLAYWESEKDKGQSHAINKGVAKATGDLLNWLNSDDLLEPGSLFSLAGSFLENPEKKVFIGKTRFFSELGTKGYSGKVIFPHLDTTIGFGQVNQPATYYRSEIFRELGPLNENLHMCMDLDIWLRFLLVYDMDAIYESPVTWAAFRFHENSKTVSAVQGFYPEKNAIYEELLRENKTDEKFSALLQLKKFSIVPPRSPKRISSAYHLWMADEFSLNLKTKEAKDHFHKSRFLSLPSPEKRRYLAVYKRVLLQEFGKTNDKKPG